MLLWGLSGGDASVGHACSHAYFGAESVLFTGSLFSFILKNDLTNHLFSCLMWDQEPEQIAAPSQEKSEGLLKVSLPPLGRSEFLT